MQPANVINGREGKVILICNEPSQEYVRRMISSFTERTHEAIPVQEEDYNVASGDCETDHGERTNYKLRDQPFYMRGRNGKMRGY
jgi:hypothetical protein